MSGTRSKSEGMKANTAFVKEDCFARLPPPLVHFKCVSAIGGHNSERRGKKNSGATLGGNLAN